MKKLLTFVMISSISVFFYSQNKSGKLEGVVACGKSAAAYCFGIPKVVLTPLEKEKKSEEIKLNVSEDQEFSEIIPSGKYEISASYDGYKTFRSEIEIPENKKIHYEIILEKMKKEDTD